jgi:hypothetical protein
MKRAPILLGSRRVRKAEGEKKGALVPDTDEENWEFVYDLKRPDELIIADDTNEYGLFGDAIFCCPQEDLLEGRSRVDVAGAKLSVIQSSTSTSARAGSRPS